MQSLDRFDVPSDAESDGESDRLSASPLPGDSERFSSISSEPSTSPLPAGRATKLSTPPQIVPTNTPVPDRELLRDSEVPPLPVSNFPANDDDLSDEERKDREACTVHPPFDFVEVSDELPTPEALEACANLPVYDSHGDSRPFRSLYSGRDHAGQRQLIIFVRHFFCQACQYFLRLLVDTLDPHAYFSLPVPTTITVIGCGKPSMIPRYASITTCPFKIYADPTRRLYKSLGMTVWHGLKMGPRPEYMADKNQLDTFMYTFVSMAKAGSNGLKGGNLAQVGGEFLFEDGRPVWCHKMHSIRGHAEMATLRKVLEMADDGDEELQRQMRRLDAGGGSRKSGRATGRSSTTSAAAPPRGLRLVRDSRGIHAYLRRDRETL